MNAIPTSKVTEASPEVGVTTARFLLQQALGKEAQAGKADDPDLAQKRAINAHTGSSISVPEKTAVMEE